MQICEALADPIRCEIVELLAAHDLTAGEIASRFAVSRPAVSRHLRVLREAGVVAVETDAQRRWYRLDPTPLRQLQHWLDQHQRVWERRLDDLGRHLDVMAAQRTNKETP